MNNIGKNSFDLGYMDTLAAVDGPLQRLDPRAKLITTFAFILAVISFGKYTISALVPFLVYPVFLIAVGRLPWAYLLKKVLLISPFAILVGMFNPLIDKQVLFHFGSIAVSGGWVSFASILLRFLLTATVALILVSLTGFNAVCESLLKLGVPKPFVVQLLFFYRYIFVLADEAERMVRAGSLRTFTSRFMSFKTVVSLLGHLLLRTLDRAERIYCAMRCRGFDGHFRMIKSLERGRKEVLFVLGWIALFIFLRSYNVPLQLGKIVTGVLR